MLIRAFRMRRTVFALGFMYAGFCGTVSFAESPLNHGQPIDRKAAPALFEEVIDDDYAPFEDETDPPIPQLADTPLFTAEPSGEVPWIYRPRYLKTDRQRAEERVRSALEPARTTGRADRDSKRARRDPQVRPAQFATVPEAEPVMLDTLGYDDILIEPADDRSLFSQFVFDPPIEYDGPDPASDRDEDLRDGPRVPEPMVFDLVRGLGARRGEIEFNVLNIVPYQRGKRKYEYAPEVEFVPYDGVGVEYEMPIFNGDIVAHKFALQYTIGTALDDAFIHGFQHISYYDVQNPQYIPFLLYLTGLRLDKTWSLFGMYGFSVGPQAFPFVDEPTPYGLNILVNLSIFANVTEHLVIGLETNFDRQVGGPMQTLIMPQIHYEISHNLKVQFGFGLRDEVTQRFGELGFRVILER